jgi:hypothetical protein
MPEVKSNADSAPSISPQDRGCSGWCHTGYRDRPS